MSDRMAAEATRGAEGEPAPTLTVEQLMESLRISQEKIQRLEASENERRGKLLRYGFPPLGKHVVSKSSASISRSRPPAQVQEGQFKGFEGTVPETSKPWLDPPPKGSDLWNQLDNARVPAKDLGIWCSESNIHTHVRGALSDVIKHAGLDDTLSLLHEVSIFHPADKQRHRPDIWLVRDRGGVPLGICEVKKPVPGAGDSVLKDDSVHGQLLDYMLNLRHFWGLKRAFGFLSTYNEWRVCWLADCDDAAKEQNVDEYVNNARNAKLDDVTLDRKLYGTPIYRHNHPDLVPLLVHAMHKIARTPFDTSPKLVKPGKFYPLFKRDTWTWERLVGKQQDFRLSYRMPPANTCNFYLLQQYHPGADGLVWLAASGAGNLVVLKFSVSGGTRQEVIKSLKQEATYWNELWIEDNHKARVITLFSRPVLLMPFAFHAHIPDSTATTLGGAGTAAAVQADNSATEDAGPTRSVRFKGPNCWTATLSSEEVDKRIRESAHDLEVVGEDAQVLPQVKEMLGRSSQEDIAQAALQAMLDKGKMHADLHWRHVALLPYEDGKGAWAIKPILIDLTRVRNAVGDQSRELSAAMDQLRQELRKQRNLSPSTPFSRLPSG